MDFDEEQGKELITIPNAPHSGVADIEPELLPLIPEISAGSSFLNTLYADLLAKAVIVFKGEGILSESHLRAALITLIATNSAHLGDPLVAILSTEDRTRATGIMDAVVKLTPEEFLMEFSSFSPATFMAGNNPFKGKTILGFNSKGFRKGSEDLLALVERSTWTQHHVKTQGQNKVVQKSQSFGPTAWVTVAGDDDFLQHPSVLKIPIETEMESARDRLSYMAGQSSSRADASEAYDLIKTGFRRLSHCRVEIPFAHELATFIADSNIADAESKFRIILHMLGNIVRINNSPAVTEEEARHRLIEHPVRVVMKDPLTATKKDYYLLWLLMDGLLPTGMDGVTSREQRVFNAIKTWAFGDRAEILILDFGSTSRERIRTVQAATERWSDKERILETLNREGGEKLSSSMVYRTLKDLVGKRLIMEMKDPYDRNNKRMLYQIDTLSIDAGLKLPHPSVIPDPLNPTGGTVVFNPFTGQQETI